MDRRGSLRVIFVLHLFAGIALLGVAIYVQARPHILLDIVLSPEALKHEDIREGMLDYLKKGAGLDSLMFMAAGLFLLASGFVGLLLVSKKDE
jgi:hypothetical protein